VQADGSSNFAAHLADRFRVEREVGHGGWGLVYEAHDLRNDRRVAIKLLRSEFAGSVSDARFKREIEILSRLDHPHIVALYEWGEFNGAPWYSMSFVDGESLSQRLEREGPLSIAEALRIARCVAEALAHAHAVGIVHRDIKPANILLRHGDVLVADFGIARSISRAASLDSISSSGVQIGTPTYMSPEQATADSDVDGRSDIYSLGCVLYEMLAGEPPFSGSTSTALVARHVLDPVPPLGTVRPSVPKSVEDVVYHALSKSPADRFQTAAEFATALGAVADQPNLSVVAAPKRKNRAVLTGVALSLVLVGAWIAARSAIAGSEARAVAAADTSRWAVFPLDRESGARAIPDGDAAVRRALLRWSGLQLLDLSALHDVTKGDAQPLGTAKARAAALALHAGRYVLGSYSSNGADGVRIHAALYDVTRDQLPLAEATEATTLDPAAIEAALTHLISRLLFRTSDEKTLADGFVGTASLPARQALLNGLQAIQRWALADADSQFAAATRFDPRFARASLWLALSRVWSNRPAATWSFAARAAGVGNESLSPGDKTIAGALVALAGTDRPRACALWEGLTKSEPAEFAAWYGAGHCLERDRTVVRDGRSVSGWSFRSGYHTSLRRYQRAFELNPAVLGALRDDAFERVRRLLWTSGTDIRIGTSAPPGRQTFLSFPSIDRDTLAFVPFPADKINAADPATMRMIPRSVSIAVQRQRVLFRDIAAEWAASDPRSAEAREAVAMSLFLLGQAEAIDTLMRAKALATDSKERQRVTESEVWMRAQFAIPDDLPALRHARELADSLLRHSGAGPGDPHTLASLAALTGRAFAAEAIERGVTNRTLSEAATPVASLSRSLLVFAAFGGPGDSLHVLERRIESLIASAIPAEQRAAARSEVLGRAAQIAFPSVVLGSVSALGASGLYLLTAEGSFLKGDTSAVRHEMESIRRGREAYGAQLTFDGLYPEAWLIAKTGDANAAIAWLDQLLVKLRVTPSPIDPIQAAALVHAMALRAELAAQVGDTRAARRWAAAVAELWSGADEFLQPTVARMRKLASP
jgi:hypothetical protein